MTRHHSPKIAVTINQENGEFSIVGNRTGLKYLNSKLDELIEIDLDNNESANCELDESITQDLTHVIIGEEAVKDTIEMIRFYNSAGKKINSTEGKRLFVVNIKFAFKVLWLWVLPIVGLFSVIYHATNA